MPNDRLRRTYKTADDIAKVVVTIAEEGIRDVKELSVIEKDGIFTGSKVASSSVTVLVIC